jgi:hypothetical protein
VFVLKPIIQCHWRSAYCLGRGIPGHFGKFRVDVLNDPVPIQDEDRVTAFFHRARKLAELFLRPLALSDIARDASSACGLSLLIEKDVRVKRPNEFFSVFSLDGNFVVFEPAFGCDF